MVRRRATPAGLRSPLRSLGCIVGPTFASPKGERRESAMKLVELPSADGQNTLLVNPELVAVVERTEGGPRGSCHVYVAGRNEPFEVLGPVEDVRAMLAPDG